MTIDKATIIGNKARYMAKSGTPCYADVTAINNDSATLSFRLNNKPGIATFTRNLDTIIIFINAPMIAKDGEVYYWSNKCRGYNPAIVEDIDSDPANGTVIRLRSEENSKPVVFETGIRSLYIPVAYDKTAGYFKLANMT